MNARNGKIARLPRDVREELNQRLERSEQSPQLLAWLNALPEVKEVVQEDFAGVPISKQNLSEWRQGGFQEWLLRRDLCEEARDLHDMADEMVDEDSLGALADNAATVLAVRFGSLLTKWDGEVDAKFEAKTRVLNRLCRSVVQLQRGMHQANRERLEEERLQEEREKAEEEALKKRLTAPFYNMLKVGHMSKLFGGGEAGRKIAEYVLAVRSGRVDVEFEALPTDKFEHEERAAKEAESVKPTRKQRTVKGARSTKSPKPAKSLEENEIEVESKAESSPAQSESVKPGQTSLAQGKEEGD
jgi:hypothetical protein